MDTLGGGGLVWIQGLYPDVNVSLCINLSIIRALERGGGRDGGGSREGVGLITMAIAWG